MTVLAADSYDYKNEYDGFALSFPEKCKNKIIVKEEGGFTNLYHRASYEYKTIKFGEEELHEGLLFQIGATFTLDNFVTPVNEWDSFVGYIGERCGSTYYLLAPVGGRYFNETKTEYYEVYNALVTQTNDGITFREGIFTPIPSTQAPYNDVHIKEWYYSYVMYVHENGLFFGIGNDLFAPNSAMTRAMFVTVLSRFAGIDVNQYTGSDFQDVAADAWYAPYIKWAYESSLIDGYGDGYFGPNDNITRAQMAKLISDFISVYDLELYKFGERDKFNDNDIIPDWAMEGVSVLLESGIIIGDNEGNFNPNNSSTRAEAATIFTRLDNSIW